MQLLNKKSMEDGSFSLKWFSQKYRFLQGEKLLWKTTLIMKATQAQFHKISSHRPNDFWKLVHVLKKRLTISTIKTGLIKWTVFRSTGKLINEAEKSLKSMLTRFDEIWAAFDTKIFRLLFSNNHTLSSTIVKFDQRGYFWSLPVGSMA